MHSNLLLLFKFCESDSGILKIELNIKRTHESFSQYPNRVRHESVKNVKSQDTVFLRFIIELKLKLKNLTDVPKRRNI